MPSTITNTPISGAEVLVSTEDTWTPILTREGVQHKNFVAGSDRILADGDRPIVLDRDRDYALDYTNGLIKSLPGGRMEIGRASTMEFRYSYDAPHSVAGKVGKALKFDGNDDFVMLPPPNRSSVLKAVTLLLWVYVDKTCAPDAILLGKSASERNGSSFSIGLKDGVLQFFHPSLKTTDGNVALPTRAKDELPREVWLHIAATYDGESTRLFVNGKDVACQQDLRGNLEAGGDFTIGGTHDPNFFKGVADEIAFYDRALRPAELAQFVK
jgi:hypothetical protein